MRTLLAGIVLAAFAPPASAETLTIGADTGVTRGSADHDAATTLGVFARVPLRGPVAVQLDVARLVHQARPVIMAPPGSADILQGSGYLVVDLADGTLVPVALVGVGVDHASNILRDSVFGRAEAGVGVELRTRALTLGADARIGTRTLVTQDQRDILVYLEPLTLTPGSFKSARVTLGLRF